MNKQLKSAYQKEMNKAKALYNDGKFKACFSRLERSHILGQSYILPHTATHWWMLKVGLQTCNTKEVFGQLIRIVASLLFSRVWAPLGNTGGANVSPLKPMSIPQDLKKYVNMR